MPVKVRIESEICLSNSVSASGDGVGASEEGVSTPSEEELVVGFSVGAGDIEDDRLAMGEPRGEDDGLGMGEPGGDRAVVAEDVGLAGHKRGERRACHTHEDGLGDGCRSGICDPHSDTSEDDEDAVGCTAGEFDIDIGDVGPRVGCLDGDCDREFGSDGDDGDNGSRVGCLGGDCDREFDCEEDDGDDNVDNEDSEDNEDNDDDSDDNERAGCTAGVFDFTEPSLREGVDDALGVDDSTFRLDFLCRYGK